MPPNDSTKDELKDALKDLLENLIPEIDPPDFTLNDENIESDDLFFNASEDEPVLFDDDPAEGIMKDASQTGDETDNHAIYPGSSITIGTFMLVIALFSTKYNFTGEAIEQLLTIVALVLPNEHILCNSIYAFKKYFQKLKNPIVKHFYCPFCLSYLGNSEVNVCTNEYCGKNITTNEKCYFLEMPLVNQIQSFFMEDGIHGKLQERFEYFNTSGVYRDVYDGSLYRSYFNNSGPLSCPDNISFILNTDGAPVFKSSKVSIWPLYLVINELPYNLRIRKENMLMAGLWFGTKKPAMNTFLKPMIKSIETLHEGIECVSPERGKFTCKGYLLAATADLPARSLLCNSIQYNGAFGCWKCLQSGQTASVGRGHTRVFPFIANSPKGPVRTPEKVHSDAMQAVGQRSPVNGVKGPSWLMCFPKFDIIQGIAIDYMHCLLLGVQKLLIKLWFSKDMSGKKFSHYQSVAEVDNKLVSILPTINISRLPRSIATDLQYWKASEFRSFLLYYGAPVLKGILDQERFYHYLNLVNASHTLLLSGSTSADLEMAEKMLFEFCGNFARLYDLCYMTLNIHQLVHFVDSVKQLGPLYTHSCFPFEDKNGFVLKLIRGTQNIDNQIITGVSFVQKLPELKQQCIKKGTDADRICNAIENSNIVKRKDKISDGIYLLGGIHQKRINDEEFHIISSFLGYCPQKDMFNTFNRIEFHGGLIYGLDYARMKKRNNSAIQYTLDNKTHFGLVKYFLSLGETIGAVIQKLVCANYDEKCFILSVQRSETLAFVPINMIRRSCMFIEIKASKKSYVCLFPNDLECD